MAKPKFTDTKQLGTTHYDTLDVEHDATQTDIRRAFFDIAKKCHPDKTINMRPGFAKYDADATIREANTAYSVLRDPVQRAAYDRALAFKKPRCFKCQGTGKVQRTKGFTITTSKCQDCNGTGKR